MRKNIKKIVFIIPSLGGGGAEMTTLVLAEQLAELGHDVHIILFFDKIAHAISNKYQLHALFSKIPRSRTGLMTRLIISYKLKKKISDLEKDSKVDLFISVMHTASHCVVKLKLNNVYYVIHNNVGEQYRLKYKSEKKLNKKCLRMRKLYDNKNLITVSNGVKNDILDFFKCKPKSIQTIYNAFDFERIKQKSDIVLDCIPKEDYLIHVGRSGNQKRHDILFKSLKLLNIDIKLMLLVTPNEKLNKLIDNEGVRDRLILPGFQKNPYPFFKHAKLNLLSSDHEGFGLVIVESLICGTPVISTDCPSGPSEILTGELAKWLVPCNSPELFAEKINQALAINTINIPEKVIEGFDIKIIAEKYLQLCDPNRIAVLDISS